MAIEKHIIETAMKNGATLAGIASMEAIKKSASHTIYTKMGDYTGVGTPEDENLQEYQLFTWPDSVKSVLVIGLSHPEDKPELDWWDGKGTLGNRILIDIIKRTSQQIENNLKPKLSDSVFAEAAALIS
ncbi:MAG: hypothetical protein K9L68_12490 [Spirochaetales bacterium]|nr:hypothetical protein [Spirochaetales bacterium]MCF7939410.1 hypothetical protein [Spirochaetales bacterium]